MSKILRFLSNTFSFVYLFYLPLTKAQTHISGGSPSTPGDLSTPQSTPPSIREPTRILDYLFLGSQEDALSRATLDALGITNVLNVSVSCPKPDFIPDANFLRISVNDGHVAKIKPFFDVAYRFIEKCRKANAKVG